MSKLLTHQLFGLNKTFDMVPTVGEREFVLGWGPFSLETKFVTENSRIFEPFERLV